MAAAGDDAVVVEHQSDFLGGTLPVTGELDTLVTDFGHGGDGAGEIGLALIAHRIKFDPDGNFLFRGGSGFACGATGQPKRGPGETQRGELKEFPTAQGF